VTLLKLSGCWLWWHRNRKAVALSADGWAWEFHNRRGDQSCEYVTAPGDSSNQLLRIIAQGSPDFDQTLRQGIVCDRGIPPNRLNKLILGYQPAVVLHEVN
jgi:hypothetical protein